jgi:hypothetical protein
VNASVSPLCERCVLPENFPGVTLANGLCNFCETSSADALRANRLALEAQIQEVAERSRGTGEYDCIVAFSGGKDSSYTLQLLVRKYRLNCLAVMVDNGFISEQAQSNCVAVTAALGVDFIRYTPAFTFMKKMYVASATSDSVHTKAAIRRASSVCNSCINLINTYMLRTAVRYGAPLVAGGYIGGQVPRDAAVLVIDMEKQERLRATTLARTVGSFGPEAARYFSTAAAKGASLPRVTVINPMLSVNVSEAQIIDSIAPLGWVKTRDTGLNSSNCRLNDLGIAVHYRRHEFHPYVFEISEQVRAGLMSRDEALTRVTRIPAFADLTPQLAKLGLDVASL